MDTDKHRYDGPEAERTYVIIGAAIEVLNTLGLIVNFKRAKWEWERIVR